MDEYTPSDKFNLNLSTLQSLHTTIERINDCSIAIACGRDIIGNKIDIGEVLNVKKGLIIPLLTWANVLIDKEETFNDFVKKFEAIKYDIKTKIIAVKGSINKSTRINYYEYDKEVDVQLTILIWNICRNLQKTNIFKAKREDAREAIMQL